MYNYVIRLLECGMFFIKISQIKHAIVWILVYRDNLDFIFYFYLLFFLSYHVFSVF